VADQFDRIIYILAKDTGIQISYKLARSMIETYMGEEGYLYTGATLRNVPWVFAYMSDAQSIFGQRIVDNEGFKQAIRQIDGAEIVNEDRIGRRKDAKFFRVDWSFIDHRVTHEDGELVERLWFHVTDGNGKKIHRQDICFAPSRFERLVATPPEKARRNIELLKIAAEVIRPHAARLGITTA
jgi:hypothetical protein